MFSAEVHAEVRTETPRARQAWADYLALGSGRSLEKLLDRYQSASAAPTRRTKTLADWSRAFGWQQRLTDLTNAEIAAATAMERARVRAILDTGYAQTHERVALLKELADILVADLRDPTKRWLQDVKGIGMGDNWKTVEIVRFNAAELDQLRGLLDDIAKETGGRPRTVRVDIEARLRIMAGELGLDPDQAVAEAQRWIAETQHARPG